MTADVLRTGAPTNGDNPSQTANWRRFAHHLWL